MADKIEMTAEGYARLQAELQKERDRLDDAVTTMAASKDEAMDVEDRSLEAAQFNLPVMEARIQELEDVLTRAVVVEELPEHPDSVRLGSVVTLQDETHGRELTVQLVSGVEVSALVEGVTQVSDDSPVGQALIGRREGDSMEVELPSGATRYTVKGISGH
ncbi:GreA/GreB family elongation factor [Deinococcus hopiensis]|uniref:Transcription elongation factor GreA n=1 Tax=Deinococcus hopiensis KR-140 TaxID=695939 RepID=A0A1W1VKB6_9DEIO|nr:GreA/GreB family elongation factor [Deinococcus hopiensis]SMB93660.1 transcription elongation factor GreA [Deinococcus hopiensis KR-140]